jgi:hypothetical protein
MAAFSGVEAEREMKPAAPLERVGTGFKFAARAGD